MKNLFYKILFVLFLLQLTHVSVYAVDDYPVLTSTTSSVNPGDYFSVVLSINTSQDISGLYGKVDNEEFSFKYDDSILDFIDGMPLAGYSNLSQDEEKNTIFLVENGEEKTNDLYKVTFKVNDNAPEGTTNISTTSLVLICNYNSPVDLPDVSDLPITIVAPTEVDSLSNNQDISNNNSESSQHSFIDSLASSIIPKTGIFSIVGILLIISIILAIIFKIKSKNLNK